MTRVEIIYLFSGLWNKANDRDPQRMSRITSADINQMIILITKSESLDNALGEFSDLSLGIMGFEPLP